MNAPSTALYALHGLRVRSQVPLDAAISRHEGGADFEIGVLRHRPFPAMPANAEVVAGFPDAAGPYRVVTSADGYVLYFDTAYAFEVSLSSAQVTSYVGDGDPALVPTLLAGSVFAFILGQAGIPTLHASAVTIGDATVAFAGATGSGKTTLAAVLCAEGAQLVSDDILRLERHGSHEVACYSGTRTLRLRDDAATLSRSFPEGLVAPASDGRTGVTLPVVEDRRRLRAVVLPTRSSAVKELRVARLEGRDAFMGLLTNPRSVAWTIPGPQESYFSEMGALVDRLPVYRAEIPAGLSLSEQLASGLAGDLESALGEVLA